MKRYITLLRGINIGGKNKVSMLELKKCFEGMGFEEVRTYINSGNVIFSSVFENEEVISNEIAKILKDRLSLDIPVYTLLKEELEEILNHAPDWWSKTVKANISSKITIRTANTVRKFIDM